MNGDQGKYVADMCFMCVAERGSSEKRANRQSAAGHEAGADL